MKKLLKPFVPMRLVNWLRISWSVLDLVLARLCCHSGILATLYYVVLSREFDAEHVAVLRGRVAYKKSVESLNKSSSPLLRRNVHRLEKGLVMMPRKSVFAESFIEETVEVFGRAIQADKFSRLELKWAKDVLSKYFEVVDASPITCRAEAAFQEHLKFVNTGPILAEEGRSNNRGAKELFVPYNEITRESPEVSFEALYALYLRRRSVRWYLERPVPQDVLDKLVSAASLAPSACNRQPFRFVIASDSGLASAVANCAGGTAGFSDQLPCVFVVVGDLSSYPYERDRHLIYVDASLASMQLMIAAEVLGLSTCSINWPDLPAPDSKLRKLIDLELHERVIMLIAVGYANPNGGIPFSQKKPESQLREVVSSQW
jgi:nitroreductase